MSEVGDRAVMSHRTCSCGRSYPLLEKIAGRVADYLITPDGELVSGISLTENLATLIPGVEQVQIVQDRRDHVLLRIVPAADYGESSRLESAQLIRDRFGASMTHDIEEVDRLLPEASGKYRFSICRLPEIDRGPLHEKTNQPVEEIVAPSTTSRHNPD